MQGLQIFSRVAIFFKSKNFFFTVGWVHLMAQCPQGTCRAKIRNKSEHQFTSKANAETLLK